MGFYKYTRKDIQNCFVIYLVSLLFFAAIAVFRATPGYMDESYYLIGARNLSIGQGFQENILWNFLDDPQGLPHPSHLYWMPLVSIISAFGMKILGNSYISGSLPMAILAAFIPTLMYLLLMAWRKQPFWAITGAVISFLGGYYLIYYSAVDAFSLYMLLGYGYFGSVTKLLVNQTQKRQILFGLLSGLIAGLMHLTRADGLLWVVMIPLFLLVDSIRRKRNIQAIIVHTFPIVLAAIGAYLLVMSPWYIRNIRLFGTFTAPGSSSNLFLITYNDLYAFPSSINTLQRWLESGMHAIFERRLEAAGVNLLSLIGVQLLIFQIPVFLIGVWNNRKKTWTQVNMLGLVILFLFFTLLFPFAGKRGGYFHAATVFQIFIWAMSIDGLRIMAVKLPLNQTIERKVFEKFIGVAYILIFLVVTGVIFSSKMATWKNGAAEILEIHHAIEEQEIGVEEVVLINDPATFHWLTERPSIVIPSGNEDTLFSVMERYSAQYVVLQRNHPPELTDLYLSPDHYLEFTIVADDDQWFLLRKGETTKKSQSYI